MVKDERKNQVRCLDHEEEGVRPVETRYKQIAVKRMGQDLCTLVEVHLITGRSHQIRVHFAHAGHPILGDRKYGTKESIAFSDRNHIRRQLLHAGKVRFPEHLNSPLEALSGKLFTARLPADMEKFNFEDKRQS